MARELTRAEIIEQSTRFLNERRDAEDLSLLAEAVERFPQDPEIRIRYASALLPFQPEEVPAQARLAVDLDPDNPSFLTHAASLMFRSDDVDAAREYVGRASRLAPKDFLFAPELANLGGVILAHDGDNELAEEALRAAVEAEPHNGRFAADLALVLAANERIAEARTVLDEALALSPDHESLLEVRGYLDRED
jgi:Flp pilus assembly protein TadD